MRRQESKRAPPLPAQIPTPCSTAMLRRGKLPLTEKQQAAEEEKPSADRSGRSLNDLATAEAVHGQYAGALAHFEQAAKWNPAISGLARKSGSRAYKQGDYPMSAAFAVVVPRPWRPRWPAMPCSACLLCHRRVRRCARFPRSDECRSSDPVWHTRWLRPSPRPAMLRQAAKVLVQYDRKSLPHDMLLLVGETWGDSAIIRGRSMRFAAAWRSDPGTAKSPLQRGTGLSAVERHWATPPANFGRNSPSLPTTSMPNTILPILYIRHASLTTRSRSCSKSSPSIPTMPMRNIKSASSRADKGD